MPPASFRIALLSPVALAVALAMAPAGASASSNGPYLTWQNKAPGNTPTQAPAYNVPPSPYGQVGDPYRHTLTWPAKDQPRQAAPQQASLEPAPRQAAPRQAEPMQAAPAAMPPVSVAVPRPVPRPTPVTLAPQPDPEDEDDMSDIRSSASAPAPEPSAMAAPAPTPAPRPVAASATAAPVTSDGGYQVPTTSKYAARIAAARAAQAQQLADQPQEQASQDAASPAGGAAPAPADTGTSLASQETDHVFIPGEQITDAVSQEPRRYSLHRQYGLNPDKIQVDRDATGALLETHFDALEPQQNDSDADSARNDDGDGQNAKP